MTLHDIDLNRAAIAALARLDADHETALAIDAALTALAATWGAL